MSQVPPNDVEAERACISAAFLSEHARDTVLETLSADDYYVPAHRVIHLAISALTGSGRPTDAVTVMSWIRAQSLTQRAGGSKFLGDLLDATPAVANVRAHCDIVREKRLLRRTIETCQRYASEGYGCRDDARQLLARLEEDIFALTQQRQRGEPRALREVLKDGIQRLNQAVEQRESGGVIGVPTGLSALDKQLGGLRPGEVYTVAARPGMGKTSLALGCGIAAAKPTDLGGGGFGTGIFSLEMPSHQLAIKALCAEAGVSVHKSRTGYLGRHDFETLTPTSAMMAELPVQLDDTPAITLSEMRAKARRMDANLRRIHGVGLGFLVLDYLQLMSADAANREGEVSKISRGIKQIAKEFEVPVMSLAQLNRKVEERKDKRPMLSDLRDSGSIEQDSDAVIFIYRDEYYHPPKSPQDATGKVELAVMKNRHGPVGVAQVKWKAETTRFVDAPDEWRFDDE